MRWVSKESGESGETGGSEESEVKTGKLPLMTNAAAERRVVGAQALKAGLNFERNPC
jgi:hypothetical protein